MFAMNSPTSGFRNQLDSKIPVGGTVDSFDLDEILLGLWEVGISTLVGFLSLFGTHLVELVRGACDTQRDLTSICDEQLVKVWCDGAEAAHWSELRRVA